MLGATRDFEGLDYSHGVGGDVVSGVQGPARTAYRLGIGQRPGAFVGHQSGLSYLWTSFGPARPAFTRARRLRLIVKRMLDIVLSLAALVALAPVMALAALAIKATSAGPVIFTQRREGYQGRLFLAYKLRTLWFEDTDASGLRQIKADDPRITPIGRFLRRTNIDELPQLLNVLKGDMSLVGPRPHVPFMLAGRMAYDELVPYYRQRLEMPPGLTGWAQANGLRGPTDDPGRARARIDHDLAYIQNFSLLLDARVMIRTIRSEIRNVSGI